MNSIGRRKINDKAMYQCIIERRENSRKLQNGNGGRVHEEQVSSCKNNKKRG